MRRVGAVWQKEPIAHFDQHKRYPADGSLDSAESLVNFVLDKDDGRVLYCYRLSCGARFDEAALV
jgi:hypothetical protein